MAKTITLVFGVVFVVVWLLSLIGGGFGIVGPLGIFQTNSIHDLIHLITGLVFLAVAFWAPTKSSVTLTTFGIIYLLVTVLGFAGTLGFLSINTADNFLHLLLGVVILIAGLSTRKETMSM